MKKLPVLFATAMFFMFTSWDLRAQAQEPLSDQMTDLLKSEPFNVSFLLQSTAGFSLTEDFPQVEREFGLGATRLKFNGNVDEGFSYNLQLDFRSSPSVLDAAIGYRHSEGFGLEAGLQKPDIGLDLQPNPGATDFINRARLIGIMLNTREAGLSASGVLDSFDYTVSVFNGTGRTLGNDGRFMVAVKGAFSVDLENDGSLYIGANGALNGTEGEQVGNTNLISQGNRHIYGAFLKYDSDNWFGAAEVLVTTFDSIQIPGDETITGVYVTIGNNITEKNQLLARWDHIGFSKIDIKSNLIVLGWNHQATSVVSLQLNALGQIENDEGYFGLLGSFQFQF